MKITFDGQTMTFSKWSVIVGLPAPLIRARIELGWSIERALTTPRRGVVSNLQAPIGTGGGSTAQDISEIEFSQ